MALTVGTRPDQLNASNYVRLLGAPGATVSTDIAALRRRYPGLASIPDSQLANYASWEDYLGTGPERTARTGQAWTEILKEHPEYAAGMPGNYGTQGAGTPVEHLPENWHHDPSGTRKEDPYWKRHPGITVGALTGAAAVGGLAATGAFSGGGAAGAAGAGGGGGAGGAGAAGAGGAVLPSTITVPTATGTVAGLAPSGAVGTAAAGGGGALGAVQGALRSPVGRVAGSVGSSLISGYMAKRAQDQAMRRSPEELAALANANKVAGGAASAADAAIGESKPYLRDAGSYYQTLLKGNRAAMSQAVAPSRAALTDTYRGANRALEQSGVRGAARDVQRGELNRQRASGLAGLVTGVQPKAAEALGNLGVEGTRAAAPLYGTAGSIYNSALTGGAQNRQWAAGQGSKAGEAWGGLTRDVIDAFNR